LINLDPRLAACQGRAGFLGDPAGGRYPAGNAGMWDLLTVGQAQGRTYNFVPAAGEHPVIAPGIQRLITTGYLHNEYEAEQGYRLTKTLAKRARALPVHNQGVTSSCVMTQDQMTTLMTQWPAQTRWRSRWTQAHVDAGFCKQGQKGREMDEYWRGAFGFLHLKQNINPASRMYLLPYFAGCMRTDVLPPQPAGAAGAKAAAAAEAAARGLKDNPDHVQFQQAMALNNLPALPSLCDPSAAQAVAAIQREMVAVVNRGQGPEWKYEGFVLPVSERERFDPVDEVDHCATIVGLKTRDPGSNVPNQDKLVLFQIDPHGLIDETKKEGLFAITVHVAQTYNVEVVHKVYGKQGARNDCYLHVLATCWQIMNNLNLPSFNEEYQSIPVGRAAMGQPPAQMVGPDWYKQN